MSDEPQVTPTELPEASDAVKQGQADAVANAKAEQAASRNEGVPLEDVLDDAQETAEANHKVDVANQPDVNQDDGFKNDTTKTAKQDTSKSQLDPTGGDPITKAEVNRAATDGVNVHGGTSVSNEEQAQRALDGNNDNGEVTNTTEDAAGNPTLGNGETNVAADENALHPAGGSSDGSNGSADATKSSSDSADKS